MTSNDWKSCLSLAVVSIVWIDVNWTRRRRQDSNHTRSKYPECSIFNELSRKPVSSCVRKENADAKRLCAKSTESRWKWLMTRVDMDIQIAMEGGRRVTLTMQTQVSVPGEDNEQSGVHTESLRRSDGVAGELSFVRLCWIAITTRQHHRVRY